LTRIVRLDAKRFTIQERIAHQVTDELTKEISHEECRNCLALSRAVITCICDTASLPISGQPTHKRRTSESHPPGSMALGEGEKKGDRHTMIKLKRV